MPASFRAGVRTSYEVMGGGQPLVLLHGFTGRGANWLPLAEQLAAHFTVIMPDIIGHGASDAPPDATRYHIEQAVDDIAALVQSDFLLVGYSMGGRLALTLAARYPQRVRSLVLESASPGLRTAEERAARQASDDALAEQILERGIAWFAEYWGKLGLWNSQPEALRQSLHASRLQNDPLGLANSLRGMGTGVMPPLWDALAGLTMPVLLLAGEHDHKFTQINHEMAALLPQATLQIIADAGHAVHLEQPQQWLDVVSSALAAGL